jgi:hypothetical protein
VKSESFTWGLVFPGQLLAKRQDFEVYLPRATARMPLRSGRVPNSSSISRCMHLKSSELVVIKTA